MNSRYIIFALGALIGFCGSSAYHFSHSNRKDAEIVKQPFQDSVPKAIEMTSSPETSATTNLSWPAFSSAELINFTTRLRELSFPEYYIRALSIAAVNREWSEHIQRRVKGSGFRGAGFGESESEYYRLLAARKKLLTDVFGKSILIDDESVGIVYSPYSSELFLTSDKRAAVKDALQFLEEQERNIQLHSHGFMTSVDKDKLESIAKEVEQRLRAVLEPEEFKQIQFDRYFSRPEVKERIGNFSLKESEMEAIYNYAMKDGERRHSLDPNTFEAHRSEELRKALGDERYKEYMNLADENYREIVSLTQRFGFDSNVAEEFLHIRNEMGKSLARSSRGNDPTKIMESMQSVRDSAQQKVLDLLGKEAAEAYLNDGKFSYWLK